ncbi:seryl-tRNA synthetase [Xylariomycetidae sp. FL2044]|nr:seryl-tRNA synthetase [Xylariomycetidae sp. FL2044]
MTDTTAISAIMKSSRLPFTCLQCRSGRPLGKGRQFARPVVARLYSSSSSSSTPASGGEADHPMSTVAVQQQQRPSTAPRPSIDIKHIRQNPTIYEQNCLERNYPAQAAYPARINTLFAEWQSRQREARGLRERNNALRRQIANPTSVQHEDEESNISAATITSVTGDLSGADIKTMAKEQLLAEARALKSQLATIEADEARLTTEMENLALLIPNLTSPETPRGDEPRVLSYINDHPTKSPSTSASKSPSSDPSDRVWRSHVHIGSELGIMDFGAAATTSGWGWYFLLDEGAELEAALIAYALAAVTRTPGWTRVAPPSVVYSHMAAACGFQPRDAHGEQQVYTLTQSASDARRGRPELCLAGTAEIPLAGMRADTVLEASDLPLKHVGVSRCYRAEAGARGAETKGLYRVHEFSKVEMFAWTRPSADEAGEVFDEMVDLQTEILASLGLRCRVLEMPASDLGASATRKVDIEAHFPSRAGLNSGGWGEVTSASVCTDYQARRLATRVRTEDGGGGGGGVNSSKTAFPYTLNGTALAVPRVLAAVLENGWDEGEMAVTIPEVLRPWMGGKERIEMKHRRK